jgi:hypothetical protein
MAEKLKPEHIFPTDKRVDLTGLLELTGHDKTLVLKYTGIFLSTVPRQLDNIQKALAQVDGNLLYQAIHILKPQLELMGIKIALHEVQILQALLEEKREIREAVKKSAGFIVSEINLACKELEVIQKGYP